MPATFTVLQILGLVWGVIKYVVSNPLVNTALDHWTEGTTNRIDDMVWDLIETAAGAKHLPTEAKVAMVNSGLQTIQAEYDKYRAQGTVESMKVNVGNWDMAKLYLAPPLELASDEYTVVV